MRRPVARLRFSPVILGIFWVLGHGGQRVEAADRFVSTAGSDTANDCLSSGSPCLTLAHAVSQAANADVIKVAGGRYTGIEIEASTAVTLSGGWDATFAMRDPAQNETELRVGYAVHAVAQAAEVIDLTVDGFTLSSLVEVTSSADGSVAVRVVACRVRRIVATAADSSSLLLSLTDTIVERSLTEAAGVYFEASGTASADFALIRSTIARHRGRGRYLGRGGLIISSFGSAAVSATLLDSAIVRNTRKTIDCGTCIGGGGISLQASDTSTLTVSGDGLTIANNRTVHVGGGIAALASTGSTLTLALTNSVLARNRADATGGYGSGGGMWVTIASPGAVTMTNVTVVKNRGRESAGGVLAGGHGAHTLVNSIVWGNRAPVAADVFAAGNDVSADHCDIGETVGAVTDLGGNINADPLVSISYHLSGSSAARDAGTCTGAPATDFEGDPRPSGPGCDIGADEFVP